MANRDANRGGCAHSCRWNYDLYNNDIKINKDNEYFSMALEQCSTGEISVGTIIDQQSFYDNLEINCIPKEITGMTAVDYPEFLKQRRVMMAQKIKEYRERKFLTQIELAELLGVGKTTVTRWETGGSLS